MNWYSLRVNLYMHIFANNNFSTRLFLHVHYIWLYDKRFQAFSPDSRQRQRINDLLNSPRETIDLDLIF